MPIVDWRTSKAALEALARPINAPEPAEGTADGDAPPPEPEAEEQDPET